MNILHIAELETEVGYMELADMLSNSFAKEEIIFLEDGNSVNKGNFITRAIAKVKQIGENLKKRITEFFMGKKLKNKADAIDKAVENNPELKNKKVQVLDTKDRDKLTMDTVNKVDKAKTSDEVTKIMEDYKRKRNKIIAAASVSVLTVVAFSAYIVRGKNKEIQKANQNTATVVNKLEKTKHEYDTIESTSVKDDSNEKIRSLQNELIGEKENNVKLQKELNQYKSNAVNSKYNKEYTQKIIDQYERKMEDARVPIQNITTTLMRKVSAYTTLSKDQQNDLLEGLQSINSAAIFL
jgi:hypothetical protein